MATQPVGEHLIINHSDSDVINDLFFLQWMSYNTSEE